MTLPYHVLGRWQGMLARLLAVALAAVAMGGCAVGRSLDDGGPMLGVRVGEGTGQALADGIGAAAQGIGSVVGGPWGAGIAAAGTGLAGLVAALWQRQTGRHVGYEERQREEPKPTDVAPLLAALAKQEPKS
jgi:hypothetical protein